VNYVELRETVDKLMGNTANLTNQIHQETEGVLQDPQARKGMMAIVFQANNELIMDAVKKYLQATHSNILIAGSMPPAVK
jgi:hypothetical protein